MSDNERYPASGKEDFQGTTRSTIMGNTQDNHQAFLQVKEFEKRIARLI